MGEKENVLSVLSSETRLCFHPQPFQRTGLHAEHKITRLIARPINDATRQADVGPKVSEAATRLTAAFPVIRLPTTDTEERDTENPLQQS